MRAVTLAFLTLCLIGCGPTGDPHSRVDSVLHPDGSVERAAHMRRRDVPTAAQDPKLWTKSIRASRPPEQWSKPIPEVPASEMEDDDAYFAAWGTFPSTDSLPRLIQLSAGDATRGQLTTKFVKTDYIVATEYRWEETLTERVTLPDVLRATRELMRLWTDITIKALAEHFGEYDFSEAERWAKSEGEEWAEELAAALYEHAAQSHWNFDRMRKPVAELCRPHGLDLFEGPIIANDEVIDSRFHEFVTQKLKSLVKRKDGQPASEEVLKTVKDLIFLGEETWDDEPYNTSYQKVVDRDFAGAKAVEKRVEALSVRILGTNGFEKFLNGGETRFRFSMKVPGVLAETNGRLLSGNEAEWSFVENDAYPHGYTMLCRSLVAQPEVQKKIFGREIEPGHDRLVKLVTLIAETPELKQALDSCQKEESVQPLRRLRNKGSGSVIVQRLERFEALLGFRP